VLQHRGQDAAGIVTCEQNTKKMNTIKDTGLVHEVFTQENVVKLVGNVGVGVSYTRI
jgi:amidophosphoribosyltransferase